MNFSKKIAYKIKCLVPALGIAGAALLPIVPVLGIAGATLLPASCCHVEPDQPHHNTTYVWGAGNWDQVWPEKTDNVAKSADSTLVDIVYLLNDGNSLCGMRTSDLLGWMNQIIESAAPDKRYKIRGAGTLHETSIGNQQEIQDSTKLAKFGFTFGHVRYINFQR